MTAVVLGAAICFYVAKSLRWRIMVDSAVMHYVVFLMNHGRLPYVQISDNNMPGAYLTEAVGMWLFGASDVGWRLFEFTELGLLAGLLVSLARTLDSSAGLLAAGVFIVLHSAEGPQYAAERELSITLLLLLALWALFRGVDRNEPAWFGLYGLAIGWAASIKPTCLPLALLWLVLGLFLASKGKQSGWRSAIYAAAGVAVVFTADLVFLMHEHALQAFVFILRHVLPAYVALASGVTATHLLQLVLPRLLLPLVPLWLLAEFLNWREGVRWRWQRWAILIGAGFGLFSFVVQRKGFLHHRYTFEVFFLLLAGLAFFQGLRLPGVPRWTATAGLAFLLFVAVPHMLQSTAMTVGHTDLEVAMEGDLRGLGGAAVLDDKVQCLDLVYGCLDALYHLDIVENSSFTGDLLFFPRHLTPATVYYRDRFWSGVRRDPPTVLIVTNQNLGDVNSFRKLDRWSDFATWLDENYTQAIDRRFTAEHFGGRFRTTVPVEEQDAYRVYIRDDSPLLPVAQALQEHRDTGQASTRP